MSLRQIIVSAPKDALPDILRQAEEHEALSTTATADLHNTDHVCVHILATQDHRQALLDRLQSLMGTRDDWRITLLPVETTIPFPEKEKEEEEDDATKDARKNRGGQSREEIYNNVWKQAQTDRNYLVFVVLSTVVAAFGMIADNVAVVVGAMVIAPLLGPNLALAVGVALGDGKLMGRAITTNAAGIAVALGLSLLIGAVWPVDAASKELMSRTQVGFDGMAIALASGAAAALSLVTGLSSALVGVMVAVALLPPTAAIGLFLGAGHPEFALGAALLLCVNVACVNLAAQVVMLSRGITPRTWFEKKQARRSSLINGGIWLGLLIALAVLLWVRTPVTG
ncbi:TIGR00341 family protein [Roseovarius indicus]|uniref:Putative hydrophobic domain protein n=1 Tax=Roseovarius indicus TaxID=540747 RepID=A0A5P3AAY5_9RHOB|nr:TIGR00341 family protein [Roseovarius indicus]QEW26472.1 putative hydrophobic domain protein [Roseovarius indicus]SFE62411.1 TIGR00341 family protein [Roseovarius indicus]